jgi:NifU-like protein involved in Fe-S cluster formation
MTLKEQLIELGACKEAIRWVGNKTLQEAWQQCSKFTWMITLLKAMEEKKGWLIKEEVDILERHADIVYLEYIAKHRNERSCSLLYIEAYLAAADYIRTKFTPPGENLPLEAGDSIWRT